MWGGNHSGPHRLVCRRGARPRGDWRRHRGGIQRGHPRGARCPGSDREPRPQDASPLEGLSGERDGPAWQCPSSGTCACWSTGLTFREINPVRSRFFFLFFFFCRRARGCGGSWPPGGSRPRSRATSSASGWPRRASSPRGAALNRRPFDLVPWCSIWLGWGDFSPGMFTTTTDGGRGRLIALCCPAQGRHSGAAEERGKEEEVRGGTASPPVRRPEGAAPDGREAAPPGPRILAGRQRSSSHVASFEVLKR